MAIAEPNVNALREVKSQTDPWVHVGKKRARSPWVRFLLMVIRRSHLYLGLLLVPWAILYGVTAYLFNHPSHFSSLKQSSIAAAMIPSEWPTRDWIASDRAERVVDALNARFDAEQISILLDPAMEPRMEGKNIAASYEFEGRNYSMSIALDGQRGTMRSQPVRAEALVPKRAFFEVAPVGTQPRTRGRGGPSANSSTDAATQRSNRSTEEAPKASTDNNREPLKIEESLADRLQTAFQEIAIQQGHSIDADQVRITSVPELSFGVLAGNEKWECQHSALSGAVSTSPSDHPIAAEFSWRRFLLRLHTAHTYPDQFNARWFWAIVVDVMAFVMVFWGVSGIAMWWQIKATRPSGSVAMAVSLLAAISLGVAMFYAM